MVEALRVTLDGKELRELLQQRINHHRRSAARWTDRASEADDAEASVQMPEHIIEHEAERHEWRADVLDFIRNHVDAGEIYLLAAADLEFAELLPPKPCWIEQQEYEERTAMAFNLERLGKNVNTLGHAIYETVATSRGVDVDVDDPNFRIARVDTGGGPEVIKIERVDP